MENIPSSDEIKISQGQKVAFGLGGFGKNLAYGIVSTYTLYYYNSIVGISASFIGVLLMAARIFDAVNDPVMGVIVARTRSKYGRYKPWIFSGAILNALVMCAMFSIPSSFTGGFLKGYVSVLYILCGITYTLSDIPFWSIIPAITRPGKYRESLTSFARLLTGLGTGFAVAFTISLVELFGGGTSTANLRKGFAICGVLYSLIYVVTTIINVKFLPTKELDEPQKTPSIKELFSMLFKNDNAISVSFLIVLFTSASCLTTSLLIYIFEYDLQNKVIYTPFSVVIAAAQVAGMILYPILRKKLSNRRICFIACVLSIVCYAAFTVFSFFGTFSLAVLAVFGVGIALANGTFYVMITIFIAGAVDYGEKQSGTRENSMLSSLQTLMNKLANAFAVFFAGTGIDFAGINQSAPVQTEHSLFMLRLIFSVPSLILVTAAFIIFLKKKDIGADQ